MGWAFIWEGRNLLLAGFGVTLALTIVTVVTSTVLGFLVSVGRLAGVPVLGVVLRVYLEVFRGSPLLVQILFVYFGAAFLTTTGVSPFTAAAIAITLFQGAYIAEIFRAGFESVPQGQREAGRSLGLSERHVLVHVVLPQTRTVVLGPLFGQYISLVKNTSLASVIGLYDLVRQGQGLIDRTANPFEVLLVVAALYFVISYPLSLIARGLERRGARARGQRIRRVTA